MVKLWLIAVLFIATYADLYAYSPEDLKVAFKERYGENPIKTSLANFGNPPYGTTMVGRVFFTPDQDENGRSTNVCLACNKLDPISWTDDPDPVNSPIVLVDRGDCSFVQKVRHAQDIGASAVIIADNVDQEDVDHIVMSDDGTGGNLYIPSVLISKQDGELLKSYLTNTHRDKKHVAMQISFDISQLSDHVEFTMWVSSEQSKVREFTHEMAPHIYKFGQKDVNMTLHFALWYCPSCSETDFTTDHPDCVSGGRYCAPDPDGPIGDRTGRDIIMEDLRQICIFNQQKKGRKGDKDLWWKYVSSFNETCATDEFSQSCSEKAMNDVGIKPRSINECVQGSFDGADHALADNVLLANEQKELIESGVFFYPSIIINRQLYRGDIEPSAVMVALCAGIAKDHRPQHCNEYPFKPSNPGDDDDDDDEQGGLSAWVIILLVLFSLTTLILILYLYRRWIKREMNNEMRMQVSSAVSQYIALAESRQET